MIFVETSWANHIALPLLTLLQLLPLLAAVVVLLIRQARWQITGALLLAFAELLLVLDLVRHYEHRSPVLQFAERFSLPGPFDYHVAVDGLSLVFMLLSALLLLLVMIYCVVRGLRPLGQLLALLFLVEAALMALFVTLNLFWFSVLSIIELALVGFIMWRWARSPEKDLALARFYQFMGTSVVLLLLGTLVLGWAAAHSVFGRWSFDLYELAAITIDPALQSVIFFLLFYGLAIRTPLFPLHGWLPVVAEHGNIALAPALLLGVKIGVYGLLRFVLPLVPDAVAYWHGFVVAFAVVGVFYAALLAMLQNNLRRLLAFAVVSHTSLVVIGLFSLHHYAFEGAVILSLSFGLAAATLSFMVGMIYRRTRTTQLDRLGGLFDHIPQIGITFFIAGLAIIGMPGTPGFDAVHLVLEASIQQFGGLVTIAAALGNVVAAGFLLWAFQRAFLGPLPEKSSGKVEKVRPSEMMVAGLALLVLLGVGFFPEPLMNLLGQPLESLSLRYPTE